MLEFEGRIGKAEREVHMELVRELTPEDLLVREVCTVGSKPPGIKTLRATHHRLAQCLAQGFSDAEASITTGYSPSRISILKNDPAFKDLLAFYSEKRAEVFVDVQARMAGFATAAVEVLQERLEDKPETFSNQDLNNLIKTTADRGGHSPVHKSENKTIVLDAKSLAEIKQKVEATQNGQIRRVNQAEESKRVQQLIEDRSKLSGDTSTPLGENDRAPAAGVSKEAEAPGREGKGDDL